MTDFYLRSRPTANRAQNTVMTLGQKVVATSSTAFLGVLFEVTTAGTTANSAGDPAWNATVGGTTVDGGVTWTTRGGAGIWQASKNYALGDRVVKTSQTSLNQASSTVWECTTAGTSNGTEPTWATTITAGTTTQADNTVTWTARAAKTWNDAHPFICALTKDTTNSTIKVAAGDTIYASKTHAESTAIGGFADLTITLPGSITSPCRVISSDDTGQSQPPTTATAGASIKNTGANLASGINISGYGYYWGVTFENACSGGSDHIYCGANSSLSASNRYDSCTFKLTGNVSNNAVWLNTRYTGPSTRSRTVFRDCAITFANASQQIQFGQGDAYFRGGSVCLTGTVITAGLMYLNNGAGIYGQTTFDGTDFSGLGSNKILGASGWEAYSYRLRFVNCKLGASFTLSDSPTGNVGLGGVIADFINCDSGGTNYKFERIAPQGKIDHETTKVMSGGATDGTTTVSHKMVSGSWTSWQFPLEGIDLVTWNDNSGGSKTATVEMLTDSASALNNDDVWLELTYLGDSGDPLGIFADNSKANPLSANAAQATSSVTWTTTGITNVMKQKLAITFTPQQKGPVRARVMLAKASTTIYVNPVITIT